jgi:hypothetical protein
VMNGFGWDLPAGCTLADIEEAFESDKKPAKRETSEIEIDFELFDPRELDNMPF